MGLHLLYCVTFFFVVAGEYDILQGINVLTF